MLRVTQLSGFGIRSGAATSGLILTAGASSYALTGATAAVTKGTATNKTLSAAGGSYALTGTAATLIKMLVAATLDPATVTAVTLSGGNLIATSTGTTSADQGARVASTSGKTTGKFYFEVTNGQTTGGNVGLGIGTTASTYSNMGNSGTTGDIAFKSGNVYANGSFAATNIGPLSSGTVVAVAVDLTNLKIWLRKVSGTPGNWNDSGTADPATNVGGIAIPSGTMVPFLTFGGTGGTVGDAMTANFGASTFTAAVPSGFTAGWPL